MQHPVPLSHVPFVHVTQAQLQQWQSLAMEELDRVVQNPQSWFYQFDKKLQVDQYECIAHKPNALRAFVRHVPHSTLKNVLVQASIDTTLDELAYGLHCTTTTEQRHVFAHLYQDHFLDAGIASSLLHEEEVDDAFRFVGMKWIAFRSPVPSIMKSRDIVYFASYGSTVDLHGRRLLYRFMRSMPLDGMTVQDPFVHSSSLIRGKISHLQLYHQENNKTIVHVHALHSVAGHLPSWAATKTLSALWVALFNMATLAPAKTFVNMENAYKAQVSSTNKMKVAGACGVCYRRFRLVRSKRFCRRCHHVICKRCTIRCGFCMENHRDSSTSVRFERFCLRCVAVVRMERSSMSERSNASFLAPQHDDADDDHSDLNDDELDQEEEMEILRQYGDLNMKRSRSTPSLSSSTATTVLSSWSPSSSWSFSRSTGSSSSSSLMMRIPEANATCSMLSDPENQPCNVMASSSQVSELEIAFRERVRLYQRKPLPIKRLEPQEFEM